MDKRTLACRGLFSSHLTIPTSPVPWKCCQTSPKSSLKASTAIPSLVLSCLMSLVSSTSSPCLSSNRSIRTEAWSLGHRLRFTVRPCPHFCCLQLHLRTSDAFWGPGYWSNFNLSASYVLDTHQYYAFAPLNNLPHSTILRSICNVSKLLKSSSSHIPFTVVGEWSLETGTAPNTSSSSQSLTDSRAKRTWLRTLFEAQLAAYEPLAEDNSGSSAGWFFWSWKQEWDIDTWSYSLGLSQGWIPSNASNRSERVFPVDGSGCIDASFNYTAPTHPGNGAQRRYWARQGLLKLCLIIVILHTINDFDLL